LKCALIGLLQSGKSTVFSAVSGRAIRPTGSTAIEEAMVPVPDERLDWLAEYYKPKKTTYAAIDCLDVPGFNFADEHGRHAASRLIDKIRTVDLLVLVLRCFEDASVPAYRNRVEPVKDLTELKTELLLADLELVATRLEKLEKQVHKPTKTQAHDKAELALHKKLQEAIESEKPIRSVIETGAELEMIKSLGFLTLKPMVVAVNLGVTARYRLLAFVRNWNTSLRNWTPKAKASLCPIWVSASRRSTSSSKAATQRWA